MNSATRLCLFICAAFLACFGLAHAAQASVVQSAPQKAESPTVHITLGQSVFPLYGPWKFTIGDSPLDPATHQPLWAEPTFDDATWATVDLTPKQGAFDPVAGLSGYVPGWTAKGHPGYSGYAWYRIRVQVNGAGTSRLALSGPNDVDDGFQVFANGTLLGSFGNFTGSHPVVYTAQPTLFALPPAAEGNDSGATEVLAFRLWMEPSTPLLQPDAGGFHTAPLLGQAGAVAASYRVRWLELIRANLVGVIEWALFLLLAVLAFSLSVFDRSDKVYYWIAAAYLLSAASDLVGIVSALSQTISFPLENLLIDVLLTPLILAVWVMVWRAWFQLRRPAWLPKTVVGLTFVLMVGNLLGEEIIFGLVSHPVAARFHLLSVAVRLAFAALLALIVILGVRQQGSEGWVALPAVVLFGLARFQVDLSVLHIHANWFPFGIGIALTDAAHGLLIVVLFFLLLRRMFVSLRRQREQALDIKQAAEVQRVILPEASASHPGFTIESEYRPAREVGGDFFQILPLEADNSLLLIAGDVSGKGLQAGMLVALLVGAIRTCAHYDPDPLAVLNNLNERLLGRANAQATCLALRISPDGAATLANAGHVPPYLNGEPLAIEGALPLGMMEGADFSVMHFHLAPEDRLVLISDGVLEATNLNRQLFGFDRIHQLLQKSTPISALADAAQAFGQEDDISLIAITRTPQPPTQSIPQPAPRSSPTLQPSTY